MRKNKKDPQIKTAAGITEFDKFEYQIDFLMRWPKILNS